MRTSVFFTMLMLLFIPIQGMAAQGRATPTTITSERMQYDASGQTVAFDGNVHVKRPDFELWADRITVYLEKKADTGVASSGVHDIGMEAGRINRIVAEHKVRMKQGIRSGTCGKATYTMADGKVVMEQSPVIDDGNGNEISGRVINFYTREGRSDIIGGVNASFSTTEALDEPLVPVPGSTEGRQ